MCVLMCKLLSICAYSYSKTMCGIPKFMLAGARAHFVRFYDIFFTFKILLLSFACQLLFVSFVASDDVQCA